MKVIRIDSPFGSPLKAAVMTDQCARAHRRPLFLPPGQWRCEIRPAVRIHRLGKAIAPKFARRYYNSIALANCLLPVLPGDVRHDMLDDAVVTGEWIGEDDFARAYSLDLDAVDSLLSHLSEWTTFKTGDLIILPQAIHTYEPVVNQEIKIENLLEFRIK